LSTFIPSSLSAILPHDIPSKSESTVIPFSFIVIPRRFNSVPAVMALRVEARRFTRLCWHQLIQLFLCRLVAWAVSKNGVFYEPPRRAMRSNRLVMVAQFLNSVPAKVVV
jgi:hypothetical protein